MDEHGVLHVPGDVEGFVTRCDHYTKALRKAALMHTIMSIG